MILRRLAAPVVLLALLAGPSRAEDSVGIEILQYGLFRADIVDKQPDAAGGFHNVVSNVCHIATTEAVPLKIGVHFGMRYRVTGAVPGERVLIQRVVRYPTTLAPPSGRPSPGVASLVELSVGKSSYAEYALEQPWELAPGTWTFQFFERDRKLAEFSFTVSKDAAVSETEPTCFQLSS